MTSEVHYNIVIMEPRELIDKGIVISSKGNAFDRFSRVQISLENGACSAISSGPNKVLIFGGAMCLYA